jgi:4-amino-4-deoxy-L-arabinose transferase-like glycosyltransferase
MTAAAPLQPLLAWAFGAACLVLHLFANPHYGVFRDELYFIVCGLHPALGYVDQPPLVPLLAAASFKLFGTALTPLRLPPALAMAAMVMLTVRFARRLGGGLFAQALAGLSVLLAPVLLVDGLLLFTDLLQPLSWLAAAYLLTRIADGGSPKLWLALGAVVGVSLWSKYLILFYLVGLAAGVLATPLRRTLATPWPWAGAALALAIIAPNLFWQAAHGFPFLEVAAAGAGGKNLVLSPLGFFAQQLLFLGPLSAPVWIAGLVWLAAARDVPAGRALAIAYVVTAALFLFGHGKAYYLAPAYPALFAAGGVFWERALRWRRARRGALIAIGISGLLAAPTVLPVLPPDKLIAYTRALGLSPQASATENLAQAALPQHLADMFGWPEMAAEVARVYLALPEGERAKAVFLGRNYGEAAALDVYGPALGGPPAISGHNQYYLWGPLGFDGSVMIALDAQRPKGAGFFKTVEVAGRVENPYALPFETNLNIYVLRGPKRPLAEIWPALKHYE